MTRRRDEILQALALALLVLLPILANATLPADERAPALGLLVYAGGTCLLFAIALAFRPFRWLLLPPAFVGVGYASFVWGCGCDVSYHAISAVYETNWQEASEFLQTSIAKRSLLLLGVLVVFGGWLLLRRFRSAWAAGAVRLPARIPVGVAVLAVALLGGYSSLGGEYEDVYPLRFVNRNLDYFHEVHVVRGMYEELDYRYEGPPAPASPLTLVVVIGESARSANWSLYGYDRETNPELRRLLEETPEKTFLFPAAVPAGRVTRVSVPSLLSPAPARDYPRFFEVPSVLRIFRAAGAGTFMASAQRATGYYEGLPNLVLGDAEVRRRVAERDELLSPVLEEFLAHGTPIGLIVLQLQGSHLKYDRRYPPEFDRFDGRGRLVDSYDNSILYTDHLLAGWIARIRERDRPAALFYVSDHGENLDDEGDGNLSHGARGLTPYEVRVPMALVLNDAFVAARPEATAHLARAAKRPGHHDYVAHTLLGLAGLTDPRHYRSRLDLSSAEFDPPVPWFAEDIRETRPYPEIAGDIFPAGGGR